MKKALSGLAHFAQFVGRAFVMTVIIATVIYFVWPMVAGDIFQEMVKIGLIPASINELQAYKLSILPSALVLLASLKFVTL